MTHNGIKLPPCTLSKLLTPGMIFCDSLQTMIKLVSGTPLSQWSEGTLDALCVLDSSSERLDEATILLNQPVCNDQNEINHLRSEK